MYWRSLRYEPYGHGSAVKFKPTHTRCTGFIVVSRYPPEPTRFAHAIWKGKKKPKQNNTLFSLKCVRPQEINYPNIRFPGWLRRVYIRTPWEILNHVFVVYTIGAHRRINNDRPVARTVSGGLRWKEQGCGQFLGAFFFFFLGTQISYLVKWWIV